MKLGIADSKEIKEIKEIKKNNLKDMNKQMMLLGKAFDEKLFFELKHNQVQANMKGWLR